MAEMMGAAGEDGGANPMAAMLKAMAGGAADDAAGLGEDGDLQAAAVTVTMGGADATGCNDTCHAVQLSPCHAVALTPCVSLFQERVREQLAAMLQGRGGSDEDAPAVDIDEF